MPHNGYYAPPASRGRAGAGELPRWTRGRALRWWVRRAGALAAFLALFAVAMALVFGATDAGAGLAAIGALVGIILLAIWILASIDDYRLDVDLWRRQDHGQTLGEALDQLDRDLRDFAVVAEPGRDREGGA